MFRKAITITAAASCVLALAACSSSSGNDAETTEVDDTKVETTVSAETSTPAETDALAADVTVTNAWVRSVPGEDGMNMGAIYATVTSKSDDAIVSASIEPVSAAETVEVHEVVMDDNGEMKMQMVERVELAAGSATELKPGSYHIMLMGMPEVLAVGTELTATIVLENYGPVTFTAVVREDTMPSMDAGGDMADSGDAHGGG
jgi:copper(I)-binding protein